jgi:prepilin-type N-terminal cleavage/methylation domain-containing protein
MWVFADSPGKGLPLRRGGQAFTLVEVMVAVAVMGILLIGLYAGLGFGFQQIQLGREDERATQILAERMEVVRLLSWDQLVNLPGYIPTNFVDSFSVASPTNTPAGSLMYTGTVQVIVPPITENYSNDLRLIQISLQWQSEGLLHQRSMSTFASRYGLQNYVY